MSQPGFDQNQYPQPYAQQPQPYHPSAYPSMHAMGYSPEYVEGKKVAETSLLFGILGLFVLGFVFGPLAIINANKAERMGFPATAGKVLGWIASGLSALGVVFTVLLLIGLAASGTN